MSIPKVFISYSHDSQEHKKWVLDLAIRLRQTGIDAIIDQWELKPGDDLAVFMEKHLVSSDYVVMVCTKRYVEKANSGVGGVGYEKMIITSDLLRNIDSNKVIPVIRQEGSSNVPTFLKTKMYIDFSLSSDYEFSFDELIRTLHRSPLYVKPEIGNNPFAPIPESAPMRSNDSILNLMKLIIDDYEEGVQYSVYDGFHRRLGISRILLDMLIKQAVKLEYIGTDRVGDIYLLDKGRYYALENNLIN